MIDLLTSKLNTPGVFGSGAKPQQNGSGVADFAAHLVDVLKQAETAAVGGIRGEVPMQDVVMKVMEAERTFSTAMAVRDKAVSAYQELSRMQI
jgi:flagellar hook-basal body complex protein FliE